MGCCGDVFVLKTDCSNCKHIGFVYVQPSMVRYVLMSSHETPSVEEFGDPHHIAVIHSHATAFDSFVKEVAEVDTVLDYRLYKEGLREYTKKLFDQQELAGEPVVLQLQQGKKAHMVDYGTNEREETEEWVMGYVSSYYIKAEAIDPHGLFSDIQFLEDLDASSGNQAQTAWQDEANPVQIELGLRLTPILGASSHDKPVYVEVPVKHIQKMAEVQEDGHPLQVEDAIFRRHVATIQQQVADTPPTKEEQTANIEELIEWMNNSTSLKDYFMELSFRDGSYYMQGDELGALREFFAEEDAEDQPTSVVGTIIRHGRSVEAILQEFDWMWGVGDDEYDAEPILCAVLELTDENDIVQFGSDKISVPLDGIRFGICHPNHTQPYNRSGHIGALQYENQLFQSVLAHIKDLRGEQEKTDAEEEFLEFVSDPNKSRVIGSCIAFCLNGNYQIGFGSSEDVNEDDASLLIPSWYRCTGEVSEFYIRYPQDAQDYQPELVCTVEVSRDRYLATMGVRHIRVPLSYVGESEFVSGYHFN